MLVHDAVFLSRDPATGSLQRYLQTVKTSVEQAVELKARI